MTKLNCNKPGKHRAPDGVFETSEETFYLHFKDQVVFEIPIKSREIRNSGVYKVGNHYLEVQSHLPFKPELSTLWVGTDFGIARSLAIQHSKPMQSDFIEKHQRLGIKIEHPTVYVPGPDLFEYLAIKGDDPGGDHD